MSGIRWVKWPRNRLALARWKRLIRREGRSIKGSENDCDFARDVLKISKRSRLCSLHFDEDQIDDGGFAKGDPKYFAWNNWGKPLQTRSTSTLTKLNAARSSNSKANDASSACLTQPPSLNSHCEKMECYDVPVTTSYFGKTVAVGRMRPLLQSWVGTPQPIDHDYLHSAVPNLVSIASQTDLTLEDIDHLECLAKSSSPPGGNIVDAITKTDERVNFYTGIQSRSLLEGIFNSVKFGIDYMKFWRTSDSAKEKKYEQNSSRRPGRRQEVPAYFQFIMCLIRIRLNLPLLVLADLFCVSTSTVTKITITWVSYLHQTIVPALLIWPTQEQIRGWMPLEFRKEFPCTRVLLDCAEFFVDKPSNKSEQYKTYSQYKSHNTYKCLFGVSPFGAFTFVSDLWSGNVSDKHITEHSGLVEKIEAGDEVMTDRGFQIEDLLLKRDATLIVPPFTRKWHNGKKKRLNVKEIRKTRKIAHLRIHIERAIQRVKCWRILKHQIPASLKDVASMIVQLVAALCNLKGPLFYSKDEKHLKKFKSSKKKPVKYC